MPERSKMFLFVILPSSTYLFTAGVEGLRSKTVGLIKALEGHINCR
jgi:hypothetical protein